MRKLTVDDIVDHRAYERERDEFRAHIIEMKRRRRIPLGDLVTIVFENTDTMRCQVQEMARAERMLTDDAIADEVATYNELIPERRASSRARCSSSSPTTPRCASGCRSSSSIQHAVRFELADGSRVDAVPEDEERLTREDVTATVHYLKFPFTPDAAGRVRRRVRRGIVVDHPELPRGRRAHRRAARRARARLRRSERRADPRARASIPICRCRASSTPTTPGYDLHAREDVTPRARRRARRSCPPASRSRSRRATQGSCSRARASRCNTASRASTRPGSSTRCTAAS